MSIRLKIESGSVLELDEETITLGCDPTCTVIFPSVGGLHPKHAVIRKIAGRWIVEVRSADSISVGDGAPTRLYWLNRGDVIRLVEGCPTITFEPDASVPTSAPAPKSSTVAGSGFIRPTLRTEATMRPDSTVPEADTSDPSKPKSVSISSFVSADETEGRPQPPPPPSVKPAKPVRKPEPEPQPEFDESPVAAPLPKVIKNSEWMGDSQFAAAKSRRNLAQLRMYLQLGGLGALGIVAIIIWCVAGPRTSTPTYIDLNPTPNNSSSPPAHTAPPSAYVPITKTKPATAKKAAKIDDPIDLSKPSSELPPSENATMGTSQDVATMGSPKKAPAVASTVERSTTLLAAQDGVFVVYAQHSDQEHCFRLGTAWAATRRHLVTTGAVAMAVEEFRKQGLNIVVSQPNLKRPVPIKSIRVNPAYKSAVDRASVARQQLAASSSQPTPRSKTTDDPVVPPDVELARAYADQARFDLGVLEVAAGERLKNVLAMESGSLPDVATAQFVLVGFPFQADDYRSTSPEISDEAQERSCPVGGTTKSESNLTLAMEFPNDVAENNWSGSPVLDRSRRVIGVYSRVTVPAKTDSKTSPRHHAIIWLGRLREFAPDVE